MRHYRSEYTFHKYKPYVSPWKKLSRYRQRRKTNRRAATMAQEAKFGRFNPFKVRTRKKPLSIKIKLIILLILLLTWLGLLMFLPFFRVNDIQYSGLKNISKEEMGTFIQDYFNRNKFLPFNNYFLINANKIKNVLEQKFALESIEIKKVFPNQLRINVVEKISSLIYDNGQKYYLLDRDGTVIKYLTDVANDEFAQNSFSSSTINLISSTTPLSTSTLLNALSTSRHTPNYKKIKKEFGSYPILYDRRELKIAVKQTEILPKNLIVFIISWHKELPKQGIEPKYFILDNLNSGIIINTTKSWNILAQPNDDFNFQINNLKLILRSINPQQYIDLRFKERVYWK